jgi:hypothetical protein
MRKVIRVRPGKPRPTAAANRDQAEMLDPPETMESLDRPELTESPVAPDRMPRRLTRFHPLRTSALALPPPDLEARRDQMDLQEKMGHLEAQVPMVNRDPQDPLDLLVRTAAMAHLDRKDHPETTASSRQAQPVQKDHPDPLDHLAALDLPANPAQTANLADRALLAPQAIKVALEIQAVLAKMALLEVPATPDPPAPALSVLRLVWLLAISPRADSAPL